MQQDKKQCVLVGTQLDFSALLHKNVRDFHFQADGIATDKICRKYRNFSNVQHFFSALLLFAKVNPLGENSAVLIGTCFQEEKTLKTSTVSNKQHFAFCFNIVKQGFLNPGIAPSHEKPVRHSGFLKDERFKN